MERSNLFIIVIMILIYVNGRSNAATVFTNGTGNGTLCGNKVCAPEAVCNDEQVCKCSSHSHPNGNGGLECHTDNEWGTQVVNDPMISTWGKERSDLPLPCQYQLSDFITYSISVDNFTTSGGFTINPFNAKHKGKFFTYGFDLSFRIFLPDGSERQFTSRVYGLAENGNYNFTVLGRNNTDSLSSDFLEDDFDIRDHRDVVLFDRYFDDNLNLAVINSSLLGVQIIFRPFDIILGRDQVMTSGLSVLIDKSIGHEFFYNDKDLALRPIGGPDFRLTLEDISIDGLTTAESYLSYYSSQQTPIDQIGNSECVTLVSLHNSLCDTDEKRRIFVGNCSWILTSPKFIRCFDQSFYGEVIMDLFVNCMKVNCIGSTACGAFQMKLSSVNCYETDTKNNMAQYYRDNCP